MSSTVDWNSIGDQKSSGNNDDLVFLSAKNLPQTFLPSNEIVAYANVFDSELNRSRPPVAGEKARTSYLFYGLFIDDEGTKKVKVCNCGQMAAKGIASVQKTVSNINMLSFVKLTSTGSGLNTEYNAEGVKVVDKPIPTDIWNKLADQVAELPTLEEMKDRLLGLNTAKEETSGSVAEVAGNKVTSLDI